MTTLFDKIHLVASQAAGLPDGPLGIINYDDPNEEERVAIVLTWNVFVMLGLDPKGALNVIGIPQLPKARSNPPVPLLRRILDTAYKVLDEEIVTDEEIEALEITTETWLRG